VSTVAGTRQRLTAAERREQIVAVALRHFAIGGLHGTSTEDIAADAALSQPYLFRLFRTKRDLFLACCDACMGRTREAFRAAAEAAPEGEKITAMGKAYYGLLEDEYLLRFQLQMYAACADDAIRARARDLYRELVDEVRRLTGKPEDELWRFFATGMLINVVSVMELREIADEDPWAAAWSDPESELHAPPAQPPAP
jgi:AcrR family transcriptional regulator